MTAQMTERQLKVNGIDMHFTEQGSGPLVVLCHGWPELSYSWRHQLPAIADAGFHAVAPDMRGYGRTSAPKDISTYSIFHITGDIIGLVAALGETQAIVIGHDWGAPIAWHCAMFRPDVFTAVVGLSVPPYARGPARPLGMLRAAGHERFYWIYFQEPGVAEAEFEADPVMTFRKLFYPKASEGLRGTGGGLNLKPGEGFLSLVQPADQMPGWLSEVDVMHFARSFRRTGFRGGLNWYRNIDRNWDLTAPWQGAVITQPALFIAGTKDPVISGVIGERALAAIERIAPNIKGKVLIEGAGHWVQQERPAEVNTAIVEFLRAHAR
jgi:pimeloyl-ACP methyl ester carboxylesterase